MTNATKIKELEERMALLERILTPNDDDIEITVESISMLMGLAQMRLSELFVHERAVGFGRTETLRDAHCLLTEAADLLSSEFLWRSEDHIDDKWTTEKDEDDESQ